jgi:hypothetical protein
MEAMDHLPTNGASALFVYGGALVALVVVLVWRTRSARPLTADPLAAPLPPADTTYRDGALRPIHPDGVIPVADERFYWEVEHAATLGMVHRTDYQRGSAGMSVRIAPGVRVHAGGSDGRVVDRAAFGVLDTGRLIFSDVRVLFIGTRGLTRIGLSRIVAVEPWEDGLRLVVDEGEPLIFRTGSRREAVVLRRIVARDLPVRGDDRESRAAASLEHVKASRKIYEQGLADGAMSDEEYTAAMRDADTLEALAREALARREDG